MSVHTRSNGSVFVRYRENGKQQNRTFGKGETALQAAEAFNDAIKAKKKQDNEPTLGIASQKVTYTDELAILYFQNDALNGLKSWKQDWKKMLNKHLLPDLGQVPIAQLTQEFIVGLVMRRFPNACPATHGNYLSYLKIMYNFGLERGYIQKNPLAFWKKKSQRQKDFSVDLALIKKIRDAAPDHLAFAMEFVCNTGVRPGPSELLALRYEHVLWDQSAIKVFAEKTQKWRTIPLKPEFLEKLRARKEISQSGHIIEYRGKSVGSIHASFRRTCKKLGIGNDVVLYDLRHWFCTSLLSNGVPVKTVSLLMGHSSAKMTLDRYAHVIPGDADKAVAHLPDLD